MQSSVDDAYRMLCILQKQTEESMHKQHELTNVFDQLTIELHKVADNIEKVKETVLLLKSKYDGAQKSALSKRVEYLKVKSYHESLQQWVTEQHAEMHRLVVQASQLYEKSNVRWNFSTDNPQTPTVWAKRFESRLFTLQRPVEILNRSIYDSVINNAMDFSLVGGTWQRMILHFSEKYEHELKLTHSQMSFTEVAISDFPLEPDNSKKISARHSRHDCHEYEATANEHAGAYEDIVFPRYPREEQKYKPKSTTVFRMKRNR